jgi:hypothetical protein
MSADGDNHADDNDCATYQRIRTQTLTEHEIGEQRDD